MTGGSEAVRLIDWEFIGVLILMAGTLAKIGFYVRDQSHRIETNKRNISILKEDVDILLKERDYKGFGK